VSSVGAQNLAMPACLEPPASALRLICAPVRVGAYAILLALASLPLRAAEDDPRRWLEDMERAFVEQPYDGVFTFFSGYDLATLRVVHMRIDGEPRERLFHMNGMPREILRRGTKITYRTTAGDSLGSAVETVSGGPLTAAFVRDFAAISRHYELRLEGADRIAGRPARRLVVLPRDADRHGYRLWLDEPSRLLLRSEMVDDRGHRLEIFQFTQVAIGSEVDPRALQPAAIEEQVSEVTLGGRSMPSLPSPETAAWMPAWLPPGFTRVTSVVHAIEPAPASSTRMLFSDGLADFSLFVEPEPRNQTARMPAAIESRSGATVTLSRVRAADDWNPSPVRFTLVGEIPLVTARRILESLGPIANARADARPAP
jgi:sigma-E factor negative regulatory protein RseB